MRNFLCMPNTNIFWIFYKKFYCDELQKKEKRNSFMYIVYVENGCFRGKLKGIDSW
jgi:hypothetical protein